MADDQTRLEVESRLGRPFEDVKEQLLELFGREWAEIEVVIETASDKRGQSRADVIVDLVSRSESRPSVQSRVRAKVIRWIGKPWRERENPWDRFKDRVPPLPPRIDKTAQDLDEWTPLRPDED